MLYNVLINKQLEKIMLKFEGILDGTRIKAFDFEPMEGRTDRYVTGRILHTANRGGAKVYAIMCDEDTSFGGLPINSRVGHIVFVPMETTMDFHNRVIPLDGPCAPKSTLIHNLANELGLEVVDLSLDK